METSKDVFQPVNDVNQPNEAHVSLSAKAM